MSGKRSNSADQPPDRRSQNIVLLWFQNKHSPVPVIPPKDPVEREIEFTPTKAPYDPRWLLAGRPHPSKTHSAEYITLLTLPRFYFPMDISLSF